jgi:hypothetical protein
MQAPNIPPQFEDEGLVYMIVPVQDDEQGDLLPHFADCFKFIEEGRQEGSGVLIHW